MSDTDLFQAARLKAAYLCPYLSKALWRLTPVIQKFDKRMLDPKFNPSGMVGFVSCDMNYRVYYDPEILPDHYTVDELSGTLLHEVWHLLRSHFKRCQQGNYTPKKWNYAADLEINDDLEAEGIPRKPGTLLPKDCTVPVREKTTVILYKDKTCSDPEIDVDKLLSEAGIKFEDLDFNGKEGTVLPIEKYTHKKMQLEDGLTAEQYYALLPEDMGEGGGNGEPDPTTGSNSDGVLREGEEPANSKDYPEMSKWDQDAIKKEVAKQIDEHAKKRGNVPGFAQRWAASILSPTIPWQTVLRSSVKSAIAFAAGNIDYTYSKMSRRHDKSIIFPGMHKPLPEVAVVIDTSGSMSEQELGKALGEIKGILKVVNADIRLIICDDLIYCDEKVKSLPNVVKRLKGNGGTDLRKAFDAMNNKPVPDFAVVLTDCETPWPTTKPKYRTIIARIGTASGPDWAKVIDVK